MNTWLHEHGVALRSGDLDESPMAYRRLPDVLAHHAGTIRVLHTLRPFGAVMASSGEVDPYKDRGRPLVLAVPSHDCFGWKADGPVLSDPVNHRTLSAREGCPGRSGLFGQRRAIPYRSRETAMLDRGVE
jgi:hypothetical protein